MSEKVLKKRVRFVFLGNDTGGVPTYGIKLKNDLDVSSGVTSFSFIKKLASGTDDDDAIRIGQVPYLSGTNGIYFNSYNSISPNLLQDTVGGAGLAKSILSNSNGVALRVNSLHLETNINGQLAVISSGLPGSAIKSEIVTDSKVQDGAFTTEKIEANFIRSFASSDIFTDGLVRYDADLAQNRNMKVDLDFIRKKITFSSSQFINNGSVDVLTIPKTFHNMLFVSSSIPLVSIISGIEKIVLSATVSIDSLSVDITISVPATTGFDGAIYLTRNISQFN